MTNTINPSNSESEGNSLPESNPQGNVIIEKYDGSGESRTLITLDEYAAELRREQEQEKTRLTADADSTILPADATAVEPAGSNDRPAGSEVPPRRNRNPLFRQKKRISPTQTQQPDSTEEQKAERIGKVADKSKNELKNIGFKNVPEDWERMINRDRIMWLAQQGLPLTEKKKVDQLSPEEIISYAHQIIEEIAQKQVKAGGKNRFPVVRSVALAALVTFLGTYAYHDMKTDNEGFVERKIVRTINDELGNQEAQKEPPQINIETLKAQGYEQFDFIDVQELVLSETTGEPEAIRTNDGNLVRLGEPSIIVEEVDGEEKLFRSFPFYNVENEPCVLIEVPGRGYRYFKHIGD